MSTQTRTSSLRAVRPLPPAADIHLFDHLVGRHLQTLGHAESKHLGTREVDHKLDLGRLQHRQISGLGPFKDATGVEANLTIGIGLAACVAHETADRNEFAQPIERGGEHGAPPG